ncbi:MAG: 16S rRNA (cytosine(1402)-N(4))-methyltransferase RsmH [Deltaproteobacteria bacterium]|nr:16S rRNA (cytosine(1402)-N(4))-methyltransferase RsmH [Deltaproteobacteria bacterium]
MANAAPHTSVLADEVIRYLDPRDGGLYVDGTMGAGGHTRRILEASAPGGKVLGIDRDPLAHDIAERNLGELWDRVEAVHGTFGEVATLTREHDWQPLDGALVDLGVSSMQLDRAERGFSFSRSGPIDMRMDTSRGETALELIRRVPQDELARIIRDYGEERFSARISRALKDAAVEGALTDTLTLAEVVTHAIPAKARRHQRIHPATRTFQALRIAVNGELDQLASFLDGVIDVLAPGGRCVVISFHSLEDRIVKRRFRDLAWSSSLPEKYAIEAGERVHPIVEILTRKAVVASADEIAANPRARSAKLRACRKRSAGT